MELYNTAVADVRVYSDGDCSLVCNRILNENIYLPLATIAAKRGKVIVHNIINQRSDEFQGG